MKKGKFGRCEECGKETHISRKGRCYECGFGHWLESTRQIREKEGEHYLRWKAGILASFERTEA